jgi:hypothetical protein
MNRRIGVIVPSRSLRRAVPRCAELRRATFAQEQLGDCAPVRFRDCVFALAWATICPFCTRKRRLNPILLDVLFGRLVPSVLGGGCGSSPHRAHLRRRPLSSRAPGCAPAGAASPRRPTQPWRRCGQGNQLNLFPFCQSTATTSSGLRVGVTPTNHTLGFVDSCPCCFVQRLVAHHLRGSGLAAKVDAFQVFPAGGVKQARLCHLVHAVGDDLPVLRIDGDVVSPDPRKALQQFLAEVWRKLIGKTRGAGPCVRPRRCRR